MAQYELTIFSIKRKWKKLVASSTFTSIIICITIIMIARKPTVDWSNYCGSNDKINQFLAYTSSNIGLNKILREYNIKSSINSPQESWSTFSSHLLYGRRRAVEQCQNWPPSGRKSLSPVFKILSGPFLSIRFRIFPPTLPIPRFPMPDYPLFFYSNFTLSSCDWSTPFPRFPKRSPI